MKNISLLLALALYLPAQAQFVKNEWGGLILSADTDPGSSSTPRLYDMEVDASGNTIIVGQFLGIIDFDPSANEQIDTSVGGGSSFIAKYDGTGGLLWVRIIPKPVANSSVIWSVTTDAAGGIYVAGNPGGVIDIDPGTGVTLTPPNANNFMAKFNADGDFVWGSGFQSTSQFEVSHLFINHLGQLVRMGGVQSAGSNTALYSIVTYDPSTGASINTYPINAVGQASNQDNNYKEFSGVQDNGNNLVIKGTFNGSMDMDVLAGVSTLSAVVPGPSNYYNAFVAKYNASMGLQWAFTLHSANQGFQAMYPINIKGLVTDPSGNIYIGGVLTDTIDFDPGAGEYFVYPSTGSSGNTQRGFVAKYAPDGSLIWANPIDINDIGSAGNRSFLYDLAISPDGQRIYFVADIVDRPKLLNMEENPILMPYVSTIGEEQTHFICVLGSMDDDGNVTQANTVITRGGFLTVSKNHLRTLSDGSIHAAFEQLGVTSNADPYYFGACQNNPYAYDGLNRDAIGIARYVPCTNVPVITSQPLSTQGCLGLPLTVEVEVSGATCTKKHWFKRSSNDDQWLTPVQSEELFFAAFGAEHVGEYIVTVEGECGSVTSNPFTIGGPVQPVNVSTSSIDLTACEGNDQPLNFDAVGVSGDAPLSYQWKTATTVVGSTEAVTLSNLAPADAGTYYGIVSNFCNSDTLVVQLAVTPLPDATPNTLTAEFCASESAALSGPGNGNASYTWLDGSQNGIASGNDFFVSTGGTYYLQAQQDGCTAVSAAITVTENALPTQPTVTQSGADLVSSYATGNQWYYEGSIINGATAQTYTPTANGNYTVVHTDANTCAATSQPYNMLAVGIGTATAEGISVSPNPSSGVFVVSGTGVAQCTVHDALGREVLRTASRTIDLSTAPAGVYMLHVQGNASQRLRVVKQ
jgi:hypothetical protein